jgi:CelD/BcsL family acetyltransferase involved in cellulose biosynthesis/peptidoglycan/xylan/chitin deacetylase (PgdA/CDA1 family)
MKLRLYQSWDEVQRLAPLWNPLLRRCASDAFFLAWEWCDSWWKAYGENRAPYVLGAWENSTLIGVAPLFLEQRRSAGQNRRCLRFIGDGSSDSDYLDFFVERGYESQFASALLDHLDASEDTLDFLDLHGPVDSSPVLTAIVASMKERKWTTAIDAVPCLTLKLPESWEKYLQLLKPRFRTKMRSGLSFIERDLHLSPVACISEEQLDSWLPEFFDLHEKRWRTRGQAGVFQGKGKREFYSQISRAALRTGNLNFHRLQWGERTIAFQYGFLYRNKFLLLQEAYDPDFESLRPGMALRAFLMRDFINAGIEEYDFLAGAAAHKLDWGASPKRSLRIIATRRRSAALALIKAPATRARLKDSLKKLTPGPVLALRQKILSGSKAGKDSAAPAAPSFKSAVARLYRAAPLQALGRRLSIRYQLGNGDGKHALPLERRKTHLCHILQYHRINDDGDPFLRSDSTEAFRAQMKYLARHFSCVSLDDFAAGKIDEKEAGYSVAITFDDGYRDNFTNALPILKEFRIPATIFLATGFIGTGDIPWYDKVCLAFKLTVQKELRLDRPGVSACSLRTQQERVAVMQQTLDALRVMDEDPGNSLMDDLFHALRVPRELTLPNFMLNWDEVRQMTAHNISFGAHTVTHPVLSQVKSDRLSMEIETSKKTIEEKLQNEVIHFAYPFGKPADIGPDARSVVAQAGFKTAVTTVPGFNSANDDPLSLKRYTPWAADIDDFILKLDWTRFSGFARADSAKEIDALRPAYEVHKAGL